MRDQIDSDWSESHPPKFINSEDFYVMLLCHNCNSGTVLHLVLSLLQNQSSC